MRHLTRLAAVTATVLGAATLIAACGSEGTDSQATSATSAAGLARKTVEAGEVTVKITPERIDSDGAAFAVVLDTHSVELDLDVAVNAGFVVDGTTWTDATWDGAGPGGHHREGTLRFTAAGQATGTAELTIDGLPEPVRTTWNLEDQ